MEVAGRSARVRHLGIVPYRAGLELQERLARARLAGRVPDTLLLLEHPPAITLGLRARGGDVLWSEVELARRGVEVVRVGRGGAATYHGPGQLVGYPIVRLSRAGRGVRRYVRGLEELLRGAVGRFGVDAELRDGRPGIWVYDRKLASIGIAVRHGVARHGFALNVDMDLDPFSWIVSCGEPGLRPIDLSRTAGRRISMAEAVASVIAAWRDLFGEIEEEELDELHPAG